MNPEFEHYGRDFLLFVDSESCADDMCRRLLEVDDFCGLETIYKDDHPDHHLWEALGRKAVGLAFRRSLVKPEDRFERACPFCYPGPERPDCHYCGDQCGAAYVKALDSLQAGRCVDCGVNVAVLIGWAEITSRGRRLIEERRRHSEAQGCDPEDREGGR
jgi:hypothetical protein